MYYPISQVPAVEPTYDPKRPMGSIQTLYNNVIPNCPGKSIVCLKVTFPPNGSSPPHTHAGAFLSVYVVSGYVLSKMNDDPMFISAPGDTFKENPGCHHKISDNASPTEPAVFVANLIVDTRIVEENGIQGLIVIDEEYREMVKEAQDKAAAGGKN